MEVSTRTIVAPLAAFDPVADVQAHDRRQQADEHRHGQQPAEAAGHELRGGRGGDEHGDDQDDAHGLEADHDGHRDEGQEQVVERATGSPEAAAPSGSKVV